VLVWHDHDMPTGVRISYIHPDGRSGC
jgi:hypothetical protein